MDDAVALRRERDRKYYHDHRDRINGLLIIRRSRNAEKVREKNRTWQRAHKDVMARCNHNWYEKNKEKVRLQAKERTAKTKDERHQRYIEKRDQLLIEAKKYRQTHRAERNAIEHRRRAQKKGNGGSFTASEWKMLCEKYDYKCLRCGEKKPLTVDHVIPSSLGGTNNIDNIQPLCKSCNSTKHTDIIDYRGAH